MRGFLLVWVVPASLSVRVLAWRGPHLLLHVVISLVLLRVEQGSKESIHFFYFFSLIFEFCQKIELKFKLWSAAPRGFPYAQEGDAIGQRRNPKRLDRQENKGNGREREYSPLWVE